MAAINQNKVLACSTLAFGMLFGGPSCFASLVQDPISPTIGGAGLGTQLTILTIQNTPSEGGCVGWNGTSDVFANAICGGGTLGDVKTGASQTLTRTIGEIGWAGAADVGIIFNATEPGSNSINVTGLTMYVYASNGTALWNSGPFTSVNFPSVNPGVGNAGFLFSLDAPQQTSLNALLYAGNSIFADPSVRIGLFAAATDSAGGVDTFFVTDLNRTGGGEVPEPATMVLIGLGLAGVGLFRRR